MAEEMGIFEEWLLSDTSFQSNENSLRLIVVTNAELWRKQKPLNGPV